MLCYSQVFLVLFLLVYVYFCRKQALKVKSGIKAAGAKEFFSGLFSPQRKLCLSFSPQRKLARGSIRPGGLDLRPSGFVAAQIAIFGFLSRSHDGQGTLRLKHSRSLWVPEIKLVKDWDGL